MSQAAARLSPQMSLPAVKRKAEGDAADGEAKDEMPAALGCEAEPQPEPNPAVKKLRAPDWTEEKKLLLIKYAKVHWGPQKGKANEGVLKSSADVIKQALADAHSV